MEAAEAVAGAAAGTLAEPAAVATTGGTESVEVLLLLLLVPVLLLLPLGGPPPLPPPLPEVAILTGSAEAGEAEMALFRLALVDELLLLPAFLFTVSRPPAEAWLPLTVLPDRWDDDLVSLAINDGLPKLLSALFCSPPEKQMVVTLAGLSNEVSFVFVACLSLKLYGVH